MFAPIKLAYSLLILALTLALSLAYPYILI
jgi:uncharacterized protein (UPF0333 family)